MLRYKATHTSTILLGLLLIIDGAQGQSTQPSLVTQVTPSKEAAEISFTTAKPLELPIAANFSDEAAVRAMTNALGPQPAAVSTAIPGFSRGGVGDGTRLEKNVGKPALVPQDENTPAPAAFGTANLPFSTSRADLDPTPTNDLYPYRAAGKLFFLIAGQTYICSASLIKRGLVITAAHCVANFGKKAYYTGWQFIPGYRDGVAPFGTWTAAQAAVLTSYLDGTDKCQQPGVVCQDDVAVLVLNPQNDATGNSRYAGDSTGWFSYGWDQTGFTSQKITHVTQIGYPSCLDNAGLMERNDSQGTIDPNFANNTTIGSLMCGGSSGGPWLINFGIQPTLTGTTPGFGANPNQVIGVTSWGSTSNAVKWMGASPLLSTNIVPLVDAACKAFPAACKQ
jgi:V8-like Glu-specific endopeptidase